MKYFKCVLAGSAASVLSGMVYILIIQCCDNDIPGGAAAANDTARRLLNWLLLDAAADIQYPPHQLDF